MANATGSLFSRGDAKDPSYVNLRDHADFPEAVAARQFTEELWQGFHNCADGNFLTEIRNDFNARFWEMYLTCALKEHGSVHGYLVSCPKPGPDICIDQSGRRIWIEAVTATDGDPTKPDSAGKPYSGPEPEASKVPDEKIILRYTSALDEKRRKYESYQRNGLVAPSEPCIIAINGYPLSYRWAEPEIPRILKALFPIGPLQVRIDKTTGRAVGRKYLFRASVAKSSGSVVDTGIFLQNAYRPISAVLFSRANAAMTARPLGVDFLLIHNPIASNPLPQRLVRSDREYLAQTVDGGLTYELTYQTGA